MKVGVVGCGVMGTDIAHMVSDARFQARCYDVSPVAMDRSLGIIDERLNRYVRTGRIDEQVAQETRERILYMKSMDDLQDSDIII